MDIKLSKTRNFIKHLKSKGFSKKRTNGSHAIYKNDNGQTISIPVGSKHINPCMAKRLLKEIEKGIDTK